MEIQTDKGHFWLTFSNGYTLSVFNGCGSYSDNHFNDKYIIYPQNDDETKEYVMQRPRSSNCEIAIINAKGNFITDNILECGDDVKGYVSVDELVEIINIINNLKQEE